MNHWYKAGWIHAFNFVYAKFRPYHPIVTAATLFQSSMVQFWWAHANCSLIFLFLGVAPGVVFWSSNPSDSKFNVLCIQRSSSVFGCNERLFDLQLSFYQLELAWPFSSNCCLLDIFSFWTLFCKPIHDCRGRPICVFQGRYRLLQIK